MSQLEFTERQTGVTVFGKMQYRAVDIDVKPGITEIHFLPFKKAYYPSEYRLCNVDKTFPDVETIYIAVGVACVDIPNKMFPNVKRVISDNKNFETSNVLINKTDKTLLNTFYKKPGELIDLKKVKYISDKAFYGCETANIINADEIQNIHRNTFKNYLGIDGLPVVDGAHMLGNIMLSCQNVIPKNTKIIDINVDFGHDRITVYDIEVLLANSRIPSNIYIDSTEFIYPRLIHSVLYKKIQHFEITSKNPYYTTDDDIIYNSDKTILIRCPINKSGEIVIPDGVQTIGYNAFYKCNIDSVIIPDSVTDIEPFAFKESEIQHCKFGKGMAYIGTGMFYWCQKLGNVKIPSNIKTICQEAFSGAMCQSIELENGVERIEKNALAIDYRNDLSITLPKSVRHVDFGALSTIRDISVSTVNGRLPSQFFSAIAGDNDDGWHIARYITVDGIRYMLPYRRFNNVDLDMYNKLFQFDGKMLWRQYTEISDFQQCIKFLLHVYQHVTDNDVKKEMAQVLRQSKAVKYLYSSNDYESLVKLLSFGICTKSVLNSLVDTANKDNNITVQAYAMDALDKLGSSSSAKASKLKL